MTRLEFLNRDLNLIALNARQSGHNDQLVRGLQHVHRRLPTLPVRAEEILVQPFSPRERGDSFGPHQIGGGTWHGGTS